MMLTEAEAVPDAVLPVARLKDHLRMGSGFADDGMQDGLLCGHLRAALAMIEGRIGKVLVLRRFSFVVEDWRQGGDQALPVAPVQRIVSVTLRDGVGGTVVVDPARYRLVADMQRPKIAGVGGVLAAVPHLGSVEVLFEAGFGATWAAVPADLAEAVILLAAALHERRFEAGQPETGLPPLVGSLIERWRTVRVLGGGSA